MRFSAGSQFKTSATCMILCLISGALNAATAQRRKTDSYSKVPVAIKPI